MPLACASWIFEVHVATVAEYELPTMKCAYTPLGELATALVDSVMFPEGAALTWATSARDSETAARSLFNMMLVQRIQGGCSRLDVLFSFYTLVSPGYRSYGRQYIDITNNRYSLSLGWRFVRTLRVSVCGFTHGQPHWPHMEPAKYSQSVALHMCIVWSR